MKQSTKRTTSKHLPLVILFDADGTLYDSHEIHFLAYKTVLEEVCGYDLQWSVFKQDVIDGKKNAPEFLRDLAIHIDVQDFYKKRLQVYKSLVKSRLKPSLGVKGFLEWCNSNHIKCMVVSASKRPLIKASLEATDLYEHFDDIISYEDVNTLRKPDPHPYLLGLKLAGVDKKEALAIEDSSKGIASAKGAGLYCIGILHKTNTKKELSQADLIVSDFDQIKNYLYNA